MKIGCKKISPIAKPIPLPNALASLTLYIMLMNASTILISETMSRIVALVPLESVIPLATEEMIHRMKTSQK